jgi:hypothetical protein
VRPGHAVLLIVCLALYAVGVGLSVAYCWGLVPLAAVVYLAAVVAMTGMAVGTFREIFAGMSFDGLGDDDSERRP